MMFDTDILRLILKCTQQGLLTWERETPDAYVSKRDDLGMRIEFQYPLLADETTSGADIAQVTCGNLILTYTSGTEGMGLVREILSNGCPEWREHLGLCDSRRHEIIERLEGWLRESGSGGTPETS